VTLAESTLVLTFVDSSETMNECNTDEVAVKKRKSNCNINEKEVIEIVAEYKEVSNLVTISKCLIKKKNLCIFYTQPWLFAFKT
jgi:hypothetical protein